MCSVFTVGYGYSSGTVLLNYLNPDTEVPGQDFFLKIEIHNSEMNIILVQLPVLYNTSRLLISFWELNRSTGTSFGPYPSRS